MEWAAVLVRAADAWSVLPAITSGGTSARRAQTIAFHANPRRPAYFVIPVIWWILFLGNAKSASRTVKIAFKAFKIVSPAIKTFTLVKKLGSAKRNLTSFVRKKVKCRKDVKVV